MGGLGWFGLVWFEGIYYELCEGGHLCAGFVGSKHAVRVYRPGASKVVPKTRGGRRGDFVGEDVLV